MRHRGTVRDIDDFQESLHEVVGEVEVAVVAAGAEHWRKTHLVTSDQDGAVHCCQTLVRRDVSEGLNESVLLVAVRGVGRSLSNLETTDDLTRGDNRPSVVLETRRRAFLNFCHRPGSLGFLIAYARLELLATDWIFRFRLAFPKIEAAAAIPRGNQWRRMISIKNEGAQFLLRQSRAQYKHVVAPEASRLGVAPSVLRLSHQAQHAQRFQVRRKRRGGAAA